MSTSILQLKKRSPLKNKDVISIPVALEWLNRRERRERRVREERDEYRTMQRIWYKIAVEVKSFAGSSTISEFHTALGQFLNYRVAIEVSSEPERMLYLAVPTDIYQMFLRFEPAKTVIERYEIRLHSLLK